MIFRMIVKKYGEGSQASIAGFSWWSRRTVASSSWRSRDVDDV